MWNRLRAVLAIGGTLIVCTGCAHNSASTIGPSIEDVYNDVNRQGGRDTVRLVREGLRSRGAYGTSDPTIPIRKPETVLPIWIPPYVDKSTGRRIDGHWQHAVMRNSEWQLDY